MKIKRTFLRWYRSFNLNYLITVDPLKQTAPWNIFQTKEFSHIEIPIEPDITTIVGSNESGKSHLLAAIEKLLNEHTYTGESFGNTDLCHYCSISDVNTTIFPS